MDYKYVEDFLFKIKNDITPEKQNEWGNFINIFLQEFKEYYVFDKEGLEELQIHQEEMEIDNESKKKNDWSDDEKKQKKSEQKKEKYIQAEKIFKEMDENRIFGK